MPSTTAAVHDRLGILSSSLVPARHRTTITALLQPPATVNGEAPAKHTGGVKGTINTITSLTQQRHHPKQRTLAQLWGHQLCSKMHHRTRRPAHTLLQHIFLPNADRDRNTPNIQLTGGAKLERQHRWRLERLPPEGTIHTHQQRQSPLATTQGKNGGQINQTVGLSRL